MSTQLFGPPNAGGSFVDKLNQARTFLDGARGKATVADAAVEPITHGLAADAPVEAAAGAVADAAPAAPVAAAPGAAAPTGVDAAAPLATAAGHDPDGLAAAARAAAQQGAMDPAVAGAGQDVRFVVNPQLIRREAQQIVVDLPVVMPEANTTVSIAPAQVVMVDPATGQLVPVPQAAAPTAAAAPAAAAPAAAATQAAEVAAPTTRGFRSWGIEDLANIGRGRGPAAVAAPVAEATVAPAAAASVATEAPAATGGGWRAQINDAIIAARGTQAPAATVATEVVADSPAAVIASGGGWRSKVEDALGLAKAGGAAPAAEVLADTPKVGLLDRIRANTADLGAVLSRTAPDIAPVADDAAKAVRPGVGAALRAAAEAAKIVR